MQMMAKEERQILGHEGAPAQLADIRFRQLLGNASWDALPARVRARFGKRLNAGDSASYVGQVAACQMSLSGRILAQCCRLIGAPLPLERKGGGAAMVSVTEDGASGGQVWTRMYARRRGFPQVIHSAKRFAGPTGLEEYLGRGFGIALRVRAIEGGIRFSSDHYFLEIGGKRFRLPQWLAPGELTIDHVDQGEGEFTFSLALNHALLGEVMHQHCRFCDQSDKREGQIQ
ncbi:DUF4166 domain-containing protein [uncultured Erythrobacter sp.]|uniref:DUF4166 domain-containing protein n=1 Tax=uncultured Erythrobacter sp. TaxID=263913 RepID=UPI00261D62D2|nr:DUF4166 domain-containing protein [uncultured Erythrobacter sp.]